MIKRLALAAFCMVLCCTAFAYGLTVEAVVTPPELLGPDKVEIALAMTNSSDTWITNVRLDANTGRIYKFGDIDPGARKSYKLSNFVIDEYQIGTPMDFFFTYEQDGADELYEMQVTVAQRTARPDISASRTASATSGAQGDKITLTYTLENTGDIDLMNVTITDPISEKPVAEGVFLETGGKKEITCDVTLDKTLTSSPAVTAESDGGNLNVNIEPLTIHLSEPFLDVIVTPAEQTDSGTPLSVKVSNTGNMSISALTLSDDAGAVIADGFSLDPGKSKSFDYTVPKSTSKRMFEARVRGVVTDTEAAVEFSSEAVAIAPILSAEDISLKVVVTPKKTQLEAPEQVPVKITLQNDSPVALMSAVIQEETAGPLKRLDEIPIGASEQVITLMINASSPLNISVTAQDPSGGSYTFKAEPVAINVVQTGADKTPEPEEEKEDAAISPILLWTLAIIAFLLVSAVIALVVIVRREKAAKEQKEEAEALERILGSRGGTGSFETPGGITGKTQRQPSGDTQKTKFTRDAFDTFGGTRNEGESIRDARRAAPSQEESYSGWNPGYNMPPNPAAYRQRFDGAPQPQTPAYQEEPQKKRPVLRNERAAEIAPQQPASKPKQPDDIFEKEFLD